MKKTSNCSICKEQKLFTEFYLRPERKKGINSRCKDCHSKLKRVHRLKNIEEYKQKSLYRYILNSEEIKKKNKIYYYKTIDERRQTGRTYYHNHLTQVRQRNKQYHKLNCKKKSEYLSCWKKENPNYMKEWRKNNLHIIRLYNVRRHERTARATPKWADQNKIEEMYKLACKKTYETGICHHVDHIVPLKNDIVCGLHVHTNLQILTASENLKKNNKFNKNRSYAV